MRVPVQHNRPLSGRKEGTRTGRVLVCLYDRVTAQEVRACTALRSLTLTGGATAEKMQESDATYDRRAFPLCRPTDCSKGAECERFKTEFINGAQRIEMVTLTTGPAAGGATL